VEWVSSRQDSRPRANAPFSSPASSWSPWCWIRRSARQTGPQHALLHVKTIGAECGRARKLPRRAASKGHLLCRIILLHTYPYTTSSSFEMFHLRPLLRSAPRAARCFSTQTARSTLRSSQVAPVRRQLQACRVAAFSTSNARFQSDGQGETSI